MEWQWWNDFKRGRFEVIAASVPCTEYSRAKTTGIRDLEWADRLVKKVLEIIQYFNPKYWWIENPREGLLKDREVLQGKNFVDIDYCQFCDWGYKTPT